MKIIGVRGLVAGMVGVSLLAGVSSDAYAGRVARRERHQQARIQQGVKSGELTQGEAARLERGEARIENRREAALEDGKMDGGERRQLRRMQNRESRRIWRAKHNERTASGAESPAASAPSTDAPAQQQ